MSRDTKFYQTKEFRKLNEKWAKELKKAGFQDIEQPQEFKSGAPDGNLKQWATSRFAQSQRLDPKAIEFKTEYYRVAGQFLHEYKFQSDDERYLWELHSDGYSIDTIVKSFHAKKIYRMLGRKIHIMYVQKVIKRLAAVMIENLNKNDEE